MGSLIRKVKNMIDSNVVIPRGLLPANYNVRYYDGLDAVRTWRDTTQISVTVFENFDGGGFNYYICEFQTLEDACAFRRHFGIKEHNTLWIEDVDGRVHYLNEPAPAVDLPPKDSVNSVPHVVTLARPHWEPIKLEDLGLTAEEMEVFANGADLLFSGAHPGAEHHRGLDPDPVAPNHEIDEAIQ